MTEHHRNQALHRFADACPLCYRKGAGKRSGRFYCCCGAVWRWAKGSLRSPIICTNPVHHPLAPA